MREKIIIEEVVSDVEYVENQLKTFHRDNSKVSSFRIYQDGLMGIHYQIGEIDEEEGFEKAKENLQIRPRPYPFELESGKRHRNKIERMLTDKELMDTAKECMEYLFKNYPKFIFHSSIEQKKQVVRRMNEKGMDYSNTDCSVYFGVDFKHVDSKDIIDGYFNFSLRDFDPKVFRKMADD